MTIEIFHCPMCKNEMKRARVKVKISVVLEDGTTGEMECPIMGCLLCHNIQIFPDFYKKDKFYDMFSE